MGSVLRLAAFLCICCLIRGVATHPNQDENKKLHNKRSNPNSPSNEDFYFVEEEANDDNVKTGRAVPQSAWSKEDNERIQPVESKISTEFSDGFSLKNFLSYLLNVVNDLKKDIFGLKEMTSLKNTKEVLNSPQSFENNRKQSKMKQNQDVPKFVDSTENMELSKKNQQLKSSYITDYYEKNGIKLTYDEETDDDLEDSSDVSDDSSHNPHERANKHEVSKSHENTNNFRCKNIKRIPDKSFVASAVAASQTKILNRGVKEFGESKENKNEPTAETEQILSKTFKSKTEIGKTSSQSFETGKCMKKKSIIHLSDEDKPTEKPLKSAEYVTVASPENGNFDREVSKRSNQDVTVNYENPGSNSSRTDGSDFDNKPVVQIPSTTLTSHGSKNVIYSEKKNEPYTYETSSKNPTYPEQQEVTPPTNFLKNIYVTSEDTTSPLQLNKAINKIPTQKMSTETYTFGHEINDNPNKSKFKGSKVVSSLTTGINENEPNSYDVSNTIVPTTSGNAMNTDNIKDNPDNLSDKRGTNKNDDLEKSTASKQDKNGPEIQGDSKTEQTKVRDINDNSKVQKTLKSKMLIDSNSESKNEEKDDNLASVITNDRISEDSNRELQNRDIKMSDKPQEVHKNNEGLSKRAGMQENLGDQDYENEDNDYFDISDELNDMQDFKQNQDDELNTDNEDYDEINTGDTATIRANESEISQHTEYITEENPQEKYDTFLEYFYKHSNNTYFLSLRNQSINSFEEKHGY